jgi:hypothetical protein
MEVALGWKQKIEIYIAHSTEDSKDMRENIVSSH